MKMKPIPPAPRNLDHPICDALAAVLMELCTGQGLSRAELASATSVSDEMIRLVETRVCIPGLDRAARRA